MKYIQVLIKVPSRWVDFESPSGLISYTIKQELTKLLEKEVISKVMCDIELPKIKYTKEEIKNKMLHILAERALEKIHEEEI